MVIFWLWYYTIGFQDITTGRNCVYGIQDLSVFFLMTSCESTIISKFLCLYKLCSIYLYNYKASIIYICYSLVFIRNRLITNMVIEELDQLEIFQYFQQNFMIVLSYTLYQILPFSFKPGLIRILPKDTETTSEPYDVNTVPTSFDPTASFVFPLCVSLGTNFPLLMCTSILLDLGSTLSQCDLSLTWLQLPRPYTQIRSRSQVPNGYKFWEDTMPPVHVPHNYINDLFCYCMEQNLISLEAGIFSAWAWMYLTFRGCVCS